MSLTLNYIQNCNCFRYKAIAILCVLYFQFGYSQKDENEIRFNQVLIKKTKQAKDQVYFKKATQFYINKNHDSTLVYAMQCISINKKNSDVLDFCHYYRAYTFFVKKMYPSSKKELDLISKKFPFYTNVTIILGNIAFDESKFNDALNYYTQVKKAGNNLYYSNTNLNKNLGSCYMFLKDFKQAEKYLLDAEQTAIQSKDSLIIPNIYNDIANLYYEQYKDKQAIFYFKKAYLLSKTSKDFKLKKLTAGNMAVVEENRNNYKQAIVYRKEYDQWKDSLNDQNKIWAVANAEKKFAVTQKQKEIKLLEAENKVKKTQRNGLLIVAFLLLSILGFGVFIYRQKIKSNKIILAQKNDLDELNATKDKLFSIVSHDLRSSVNALKTSNSKLLSNLETKNYNELDVLLHKNASIANSSYNLLDNLLNWSLQQTNQQYFYQESINLNAIVNQVVYNYKPLFFDKNISFESKIDKQQLIFADADAFKIVLRNVLDNAIKFSVQNGTISIYNTKTNNDFCQLIIEDTGVGMSKTILDELLKESPLLFKKENNEIIGTGLGMQLCKSMMAKNGGKLDIESKKGNGTKIILYVPVAGN